ncbi:2-C-methyl-D-erythritol 4-phosphate cytidylyltransferase [Spongiibacter tropicus]|uniref:2-C-methyl-D-erythritol 4-phosphate cytidylyltransferase n=1 Tax=Spongiibacter tropicus TaxID=454602 RepID=UPI0024E2014A|nr:2-C-methyl-D-erythritol 4-phosphate cytidylyltransferase [Spongiibacter tropicus]
MSCSPAIWAIIPAAGLGSRFGASRPKQYLPLNDRTVLEHSIDRVLSDDRVRQVLVALHPEDSEFAALSCSRLPRVRTVEGGSSRADSVEQALLALAGQAGDDDWVLVHDAARPCLSEEDLLRLLDATLNTGCGGLLATPVVDTLKHRAENAITTVDRRDLWRALTPQIFRYRQLLDALQHCRQQGLLVTDEASAIEHCGGEVSLVNGSARNIKITYPEDLPLAAFFLQQRDGTSDNEGRS